MSLRRRQASEYRDPRGATLGTGWMTNPGRPTMPEWDAEMAFRAQTSQWLVGRAVELIADRISSWPFRVGADPEKPEDYDTKAKLAQLLGPAPGSPNPEFSARALWKWSIINYLVTGRFGWEIERGKPKGPRPGARPIRPGQTQVTIESPDSSGIVGLWPLVTAILHPIHSDPSIPAQRRQYFSGFELRPYGATQYVQYKRDEVAYGWNPSSHDPRQPFSALQSLRLNVNILYEMDSYTWAFIDNDATPAGMMVHPKVGSTPEDTQNWRDRILGNHRGAKNANKLHFTEATVDENGKVAGALEYIAMGVNNRDSQMSVIYDQQLQAVSGGLGVPMSRLDASGRTYNNALQEDWNWHEDKLLPLSRELDDIVNRELSPKFDDGNVGWHDLSDVRALKPRMSEGVQFSAVEGDMLRNERRMFAGLGDVDLEALKKEKEDDAAMATPLLLPPPGDSLGRLPAAGINPSIGHAGAAKPGVESQSKPASDQAANAATGNPKPGAIPARRPATRAIPEHAYQAPDDADLDEDPATPCEVCNVAADEHATARSEEFGEWRGDLEPRDWHGRWVTAGGVAHDLENLPIGTKISHTQPGFDDTPDFPLGQATIIGHSKTGYKVQEERPNAKPGDYLDQFAVGPKRIKAIHTIGAGPGRLEALNGSSSISRPPSSTPAADAVSVAEYIDRTTHVTTPGDVTVMVDGQPVHRSTKALYTHFSYVKLANGEQVYGTFHGSPDLAVKAARAHAALFQKKGVHPERKSVSLHVVPTHPAPAKRHAGPDGHDHVASGHHPAGSLADALVKHRERVARRYTAMLGQQLGDLDARAVSSTQARAQGKRGQQLLRDGEVRADALFESAFWIEATRAAVEPVFFAVATSAELALGLEPEGADLEAWASARATAFAETRVAAQLERFGVALANWHAAPADLGNREEAFVASATDLRGEGVSSSVVADAFDDAVRSLQPSAQVETVRDLLTRFAAGDIDLDQARLELETAP